MELKKMKEEIEFLRTYCKFESEYDCYVLYGIARKKNNINITNSQEVVFREIIKETENIEKKYTKLLTQCENYKDVNGNNLNFYIYLSVNPRDVKKAYLTFKVTLLKYEKEMLYGVSMSNQLKRLDSVWISSLMKIESRSKHHRKFLLDIDTKNEDNIKKIIDDIQKFTIILDKRETKNGWHFIVEPYNKNCGKEFAQMEIKTDALLFINNIEVE